MLEINALYIGVCLVGLVIGFLIGRLLKRRQSYILKINNGNNGGDTVIYLDEIKNLSDSKEWHKGRGGDGGSATIIKANGTIITAPGSPGKENGNGGDGGYISYNGLEVVGGGGGGAGGVRKYAK